MITIKIGKIGSGKTLTAVRSILNDEYPMEIYTNIKFNKKIKNIVELEMDMLIVTEYNEKKGIDVPKSVNTMFWQDKNYPITIILDECHNVLNPRRSHSAINIVMTDVLSLLRRIIGSRNSGYGELVLITQLPRRIDPIARDMATLVEYHICHYKKSCKSCGYTIHENSDSSTPAKRCHACGSLDLDMHSHKVEVYQFANMRDFDLWDSLSLKTWFRHYILSDVGRYFTAYDTLSWDNLLSKYY